MTPQDHLTAFYKSLQAWIDDGCPDDHKQYGRSSGICSNLIGYFYENNLSSTLEAGIADLLTEQFTDAGLDPEFPFNGGLFSKFEEEGSNRAMYANPARLAWIKARAGE